MVTSTLRSIVGAGLRRVDYLLQPHFCLARPLFVADPTANSSAGIYTAGDWCRNRALQTEPFGLGGDRYRSDEDYRQYISSIHESKILSVQSLIQSFDIAQYRRIIELGCGDMPQAYVVFSRFPGICYTATDFDRHVIERCAQLRLLAGIRKSVFDVARDDLDELKNHDLVISWSLEFSLDDAHLTKLFAACKRNSVPYLLCTHTAIGPIGYLYRAWSIKRLTRQARGNRLRMLGWLRSVGEISRLARQAGMSLRWKSYNVNHTSLFFAP